VQRPERLSILYVGSLPPARHGVAVVCGQLLAGFAAAGHRVRAISPVEEDAGGADDRSAAALSGVAVDWLRMPHVPSNHALAPEAYRRELQAGFRRILDRLVAAERPDVLLIGNTSMGEHLPELARPHALPSVLMFHGITTAAMLERTLPESLHQRLLAGFRHADRLVAVAPHIALSVRPLGFDDVPVIENPVDVRRFAPRPKDPDLMRRLGIAPGDVVVAHASKLAPVKRPMDIVHAAPRALRADPRLLFLILGDGALRSSMEQTCVQLGLSERFRFAGWIDHAAVPDHLSLADVVVMPSELEGQSLVYLETQACGRVLLASDIPAAREFVVDGETGLLFRTGDVGHLADRLLAAAADSRLREAIGRRARRAAENHALEGVVLAYVALFRETIARFRH
jgi:glycosyltransferase involved in cell wall biosynthesis